MYPVSEAYIEQMMKRGTRRRLTGSIGSIPFSGSDVVQNSFNVSGRATEESDTKIGGVYLGELALTFVPSFLQKVPRDQYEGKEVSINIGLLVTEEGEEPAWVDIPVGVYTLDAPKISKQGIAVTGFDHMQKLDRKFTVNVTSATPWGYLSYMATACGVEIGNTEAEIEEMPNGTELLGLYQENGIETFRDLLYWLAQTLGGFACAGRDGKIYIRKFGVNNNVELDEEHRDIDVVFSGYITKWTGVSFVDIESQFTRYYGLEVDDGLTMNMGGNPLLQLGSADAVERRRRAVLNAVADIQYTPFYCNSARDPIFDLGDEIAFTGGISGDCTGCVMAYDYTLTNFNFEGYGDNPSLSNARSKTDKNISGLIQSTVENEITFYNFTNLEAITFGSEQEVSIARLRFTSAQKTTVKIMHEFIFDMVSDLALGGSYEVLYYLDNELVAYSPYEQLGAIVGLTEGNDTSFSICRDFFYVLKDIEPNLPHIWEVKILAHGIDSITIDETHAHITLEGQRMYGEDYFDGLIEASDELIIIPLGYLSLISISDSASVAINNAAIASVSDNIVTLSISTLEVIPFAEGTGADAPQIRLRGGAYINTEDGKRLCTEEGIRLITSR